MSSWARTSSLQCSHSPLTLDQMWEHYQSISASAGLPQSQPQCLCQNWTAAHSDSERHVVSEPLIKGNVFECCTPAPSQPLPSSVSPCKVQQHYVSEGTQKKDPLAAPTAGVEQDKQWTKSVLEPVSLQEACRLLKPEFVRRSENRQRKIKERVRGARVNKSLIPAPAPDPLVRSHQFIPMGRVKVIGWL